MVRPARPAPRRAPRARRLGADAIVARPSPQAGLKDGKMDGKQFGHAMNTIAHAETMMAAVRDYKKARAPPGCRLPSPASSHAAQA